MASGWSGRGRVWEDHLLTFIQGEIASAMNGPIASVLQLLLLVQIQYPMPPSRWRPPRPLFRIAAAHLCRQLRCSLLPVQMVAAFSYITSDFVRKVSPRYVGKGNLNYAPFSREKPISLDACMYQLSVAPNDPSSNVACSLTFVEVPTICTPIRRKYSRCRIT